MQVIINNSWSTNLNSKLLAHCLNSIESIDKGEYVKIQPYQKLYGAFTVNGAGYWYESKGAVDAKFTLRHIYKNEVKLCV